MGAWGPGNFENDAVSDWIAELKEWSSVRNALDRVNSASPGDYVGADLCCVALGAAEVVAACLGRPGVIPQALEVWAKANQHQCDDELRRLAEACVRKVDTESELQELFDDGGRNDHWHDNLKDLLNRLR